MDRIKYKPVLYIPSKTKTEWKTINGGYLESIEFGDIQDAREFVRNYSKAEGFKIYGSTNYDYVAIHQNFTQDYDTECIKVVNIDIEVGSEDGFPDPQLSNQPVTAITCSIDGAFYTFGCGEYKVKQDNVTYTNCTNEKDLLKQFMLNWRKWDADIVTGWNVQGFDIPYLYNRISKLFGEKHAKRLSPVNMIREREYEKFNRKQIEIELIGLPTLDYLEMYRKFTYSQQESYRLDHIAHVELGENKLDYSEVESLHQLYKLDYEKFIDYNIKDVELVDKLEDKMKLIDMALAIAYDAKVVYRDVFTQVRMWDILIHNWLYDQNISIPPKELKEKNTQYAGGYVKDPQIGAHDWVMSFDLNSLYPHLIMQYNISPDTFVGDYVDVTVDELLDKKCPEFASDMCMAGNGYLFKKDKQGFLPKMMDKMYTDRVKAKVKMLESQELLEQVNRRLNDARI
jgi:DNA polymerase elongation subunit (family B)